MNGLRSISGRVGISIMLANSTATTSPSRNPEVTSVTLLSLVPTVICRGLSVFPSRTHTNRLPCSACAPGSVTVISNSFINGGSGTKRNALFGMVKISGRSKV